MGEFEIFGRRIKRGASLMSEKYSSASKSKLLGTVLLILALFGFFVFIYRLCYYHYEYDPQYSPVDYGKYNILSYFTVQSNFFAYVYFLCAALSIFGVKKAEKIGFNPYIGALVTVYVLVAGITYCAGIPMGLTPPFKWDTPAHSMSSFIQVYYHMIMPPAALIVWFFPFTDRAIGKKCFWLSGIYPLVYSIFSMVRGRFSDPTYYPYPFYNPEFIWETVAKNMPFNIGLSYLIIAALLIFGILIFALLTLLIAAIHNKLIKRTK